VSLLFGPSLLLLLLLLLLVVVVVVVVEVVVVCLLLSAALNFELNKVPGNIHCPFSLTAFICLEISQVSNLFIYLFIYYIFVYSNSVLVL